MGFLQSKKSGLNQNVEGRRLISIGNCSGGIKLGQVTSAQGSTQRGSAPENRAWFFTSYIALSLTEYAIGKESSTI